MSRPAGRVVDAEREAARSADASRAGPVLAPEIRAYYEAALTAGRLDVGPARLEWARAKELVLREIPPPPRLVADVGGGEGRYAFWLAEMGYRVVLVDPVEAHVEAVGARVRRSNSGRVEARVGDARALPLAGGVADVVLLFGPLYHLIDRADRLAALGEARRVLRPGGCLFALAIGRGAPVLDALARGQLAEPGVARALAREALRGVHRNESGRLDDFTTSYLHRPEDLDDEVQAAGFEAVRVLGVEGPGWLLPDVAGRWADLDQREHLLQAARVLEADPSGRCVSAHLMALARRPAAAA